MRDEQLETEPPPAGGESGQFAVEAEQYVLSQ